VTTFVYRSTDTGAPASVTGASSNVTLAAVLRGCLINGYNSQSGVTATRTGGIATFTKTSHGFNQGGGITSQPGQVLTITGFTGGNAAAYNITKGVVLSVTTNTWTMATTSGTDSATGTGTAIVAPADYLGSLWTEPFAASGGISTFQLPAVGTSNRVFRLDENTSAQNAQGRLYETMTGLSAGVNPSPTLAQVALGSGPYIYKSSTADSTARAWEVFTNGKWVVLFVKNATGRSMYYFGDPQTRKSGDAYQGYSCLDASASATGLNCTPTTFSTGTSSGNIINVGVGGYMMRRSDQTGTGIAITKVPMDASAAGVQFSNSGVTSEWGNSGIAVAGLIPYPNGPDGSLVMTGVNLYEATGAHWRGSMPGLWIPCHSGLINVVAVNDVVIGAADQAGKTFEFFSASSTPASLILVETSDTWVN
jgi:hypothetical protein